jgi:hypothetical protein
MFGKYIAGSARVAQFRGQARELNESSDPALLDL